MEPKACNSRVYASLTISGKTMTGLHMEVVLPTASAYKTLKSGLPLLGKSEKLHTSECIRSELPWNGSIQRPWLVDIPSHAVWSGFRSRRVAS